MATEDPGLYGSSYPLDPELHVAGGQGMTVGPGQALAQVEDVPEPVVGDLPPLRERRHDRTLGPRFHEPVEELHAELDVRPRDRGGWIGVVRNEARRDSK